MNKKSRAIVLKNYPTGLPKTSDFEIIENLLPQIKEGEVLVLPSVLPGHERDGTDYRPFMLDGVLYQKCNCCHKVKSFDEFPDNQNSDNKGISIYNEIGRDTGHVTKKRKQCKKK